MTGTWCNTHACGGARGGGGMVHECTGMVSRAACLLVMLRATGTTYEKFLVSGRCLEHGIV